VHEALDAEGRESLLRTVDGIARDECGNFQESRYLRDVGRVGDEMAGNVVIRLPYEAVDI